MISVCSVHKQSQLLFGLLYRRYLYMPRLSRFSDEEIKRMKRLNFNEGKSYSSVAKIINRDS